MSNDHAPGGRLLARHELRAAFARSLSAMYGREVPAYTTLVDVASAVNTDALARNPETAQRLGSIDRVTAERHGAIRLGTPEEMRQVARIFAALGMYPVGFYDLRDASAASVPVVSTAFRPVDAEELARNPFRVFTSLLTAWDPAFFDSDLRAQLEEFLSRREVFGAELLALADRADAEDGLETADAHRFLDLATAAFELSPAPVDRAWYAALERISPVAADVGGVASTHINHLTPRVLDIDDLYRRMTDRGITMIDEIQGPPRWDGPDVLLRQTSFRALSEPRTFREADGSTATGSLRVRFGEVEARGIALTRTGRSRYDAMLAEVDTRLADAGPVGTRPTRADIARAVWAERLPDTEQGLAEADLAFFTYALTATGATAARAARDPGPHDLAEAVARGWVRRDPIVYEDFLPRSAAGIFASNIGNGAADATSAAPAALPSGAVEDGRDLAWMAEILQRPVADPHDLCGAQRAASLSALAADLGWRTGTPATTPMTETLMKEYA